jgi:hypothetical protein
MTPWLAQRRRQPTSSIARATSTTAVQPARAGRSARRSSVAQLAGIGARRALTAAAPTRRSRHHRSPRPPELHRRPDPESLKWNRRRRPAAAAPPSRLERVGLVAELDVAARPRARVWVASQVNAALSVLQIFRSVVDDPVPRCAHPPPASSSIARASSSPRICEQQFR